MSERDPRAAAIRELLLRLGGSGETGDDGGEAEQALAHLSDLEGESAELRAELARNEERANSLFEAILALAAGDLSRSLPVSDDNDVFDGVAVGINSLREEFDSAATVLNGVLEFMADAVVAVDLDGAITLANRAACTMVGCVEADLKEMFISSVLSTFPSSTPSRGIEEVLGRRQDEDAVLTTRDDRRIPVSVSISRMRDSEGQVVGAICVARDVSERRRMDQEREQMREALEQQAALIVQLSAPVIPLTEEIVAMPLVGTIDATRAGKIMEALLDGVARSRARAAILDITGVAVVDTQVASMLLRTAAAARLLGVHVVLTGVRPEVASTLVTLGVDMGSLATATSLKQGLTLASRMLDRGSLGGS